MFKAGGYANPILYNGGRNIDDWKSYLNEQVPRHEMKELSAKRIRSGVRMASNDQPMCTAHNNPLEAPTCDMSEGKCYLLSETERHGDNAIAGPSFPLLPGILGYIYYSFLVSTQVPLSYAPNPPLCVIRS